MKPLLPLVFAAALLCGCPDAKPPKIPPKAPEPKIAERPQPGAPDAGFLGARPYQSTMA